MSSKLLIGDWRATYDVVIDYRYQPCLEPYHEIRHKLNIPHGQKAPDDVAARKSRAVEEIAAKTMRRDHAVFAAFGDLRGS